MADSRYPAQQIDIICESSEVRVAEITLPPFAETPRHRHTHAQEICWCLEGQLTWQTPGQLPITLQTGERVIFPANHEHTLSNRGEVPCRFLLVHGVGHFDFVTCP